MGIGGSGISSVASLAVDKGFVVTGCDLSDTGTYTKQLQEKKVQIVVGHAKEHLVNKDMLIVSPAVYFTSNENPEFLEARKKKKIMTWQKFLGKYLQKEMEVLCVAGTHGKSTTTGLLASILISAGFDPSVMIGANVSDWGGNMRNGSSKYFVTESDEFFDNFLNYIPSAIILNNIEYDHPDYFKREKQMYESYIKHINSLVGKKVLVINQDSVGNKRLFEQMHLDKRKDLMLYGYTIKGNRLFEVDDSWVASEIIKTRKSTSFTLTCKKINFSKRMTMKLLGTHNISNAMGAVILAHQLKISDLKIQKALKQFSGVVRRVELVGKMNGAWVYDDYAHHPTEIKATIAVLRQRYPKNKIWLVCEAHSFNRTKTLLSGYKDCFNGVEEVIIAPIFRARDKKTYNLTPQTIVDIASNGDYGIRAPGDFVKITSYLKKHVFKGDVIVTMGAGGSTKLAHMLITAK